MKKLRVILWYKIKRFLTKRKIKDLKKAINSLNQNQNMIISIVNFIMSNGESKLIYSPLTITYFLEYNDVMCKIDDDIIIVTNEFYSYDIAIPRIIIYDIRERFINHLESRKKQIERKISGKMNLSLTRFYEQITSLPVL